MEPNYLHAATANTPGGLLTPVTPAAEDLPGGIAKTVVALSSGNVTIVPADNGDDEEFEFTSVVTGWCAPCRVRRVTAATATVAAVYR